MIWKCKYCSVSYDKRALLFKHYRLKHGSYTRTEPFPCLHDDCLCTFKSMNALKVHLTRHHSKSLVKQPSVCAPDKFCCLSCGFAETCSETEYMKHLYNAHLKVKHQVSCPYKGCNFNSNVYGTFKTHKSRFHKEQDWRCFKSEIIGSCGDDDDDENDLIQENMSDVSVDLDELGEEGSTVDACDLAHDLEHNFACLLLKLQAVLHVPESTVQEMVQRLCELDKMSEPLMCNRVRDVLKKYYADIDETIVKEVTSAVSESNILRFCAKDGPLGTSKRRAAYVRREFAQVSPIEYVVEKGKKTSAYVPIIPMLQNILNKPDVLQKAMSKEVHVSQEYRSYKDGQYFKENTLLATEEFTIALGLYVDDYEVANPIGSSKLKHKMCAVYWVIANIPPKFRSGLNMINLAMLCNTTTVKQCGYAKVLEPLLHDLKTLEENGVFLERLGASVKGTVLYVCADNLGAHSLAGFQESFIVDRFCRFCLASKSQLSKIEVSSSLFESRTIDTHNTHVKEVEGNPDMTRTYGVKSACPLTTNLDYFHAITGYPPDIMHDVLEGIVPIELSLCLKDLIGKGYFTLDVLNQSIRLFKYSFSDKTDRPQLIGKGFASSHTIGGNAHENWCLIRLLPFLIGHAVPEGDDTWHILMLLKDIVELTMSPRHTEDTLQFLESKISDHRTALQLKFPDFRLRPKHHFIEHYPELTRKFGPLPHVWTMRFEGKHKFFKGAIRNSKNFKNVAMSLATKHQKAVTYHLDSVSYFRPSIELTKVTPLILAALPLNVQREVMESTANTGCAFDASSVFVDNVQYHPGMILSTGACSGLPRFVQIQKIVAGNKKICFICHKMTAWYSEHLRSYELEGGDIPSMSVVQLSALNDVFPLSAYRINGKLMVTLKQYIIC